jgi:hypothetical protein
LRAKEVRICEVFEGKVLQEIKKAKLDLEIRLEAGLEENLPILLSIG